MARGLVFALGMENPGGAPRDLSYYNHNPASLTDATIVNNNQYGQGMSFNGSSAYITYPGRDMDFTSESFTIYFRVTVTSLPDNGVIWANGSFFANGWWLILGGDGSVVLYSFFPGAPQYSVTYLNGGSVAAGGSYDIMVVRTGTATNWYVNGVLTISWGAMGNAASTSNALVYVGKRPDFGQYLDAVIHELRVYNRELTSEEIATVFAGLG